MELNVGQIVGASGRSIRYGHEYAKVQKGDEDIPAENNWDI